MSVNLNMLKKIIGLWIVLFLIFGGAYKTPIGNISTAHIIVAWFFIITLGVLSTGNVGFYIRNMKSLKHYFFYFFIILTLFFVSLFNYSFLGSGDSFFIYYQLKIISVMFISFFMLPIIIFSVKRNLTSKQITLSIVFFLFFLSVFSLVQLFHDSFRIWFLNLTAIDGYWQEWASKSNRAIGLKGMSIWDTSIAYAFFTFIFFKAYSIQKNDLSIATVILFLLFVFVLVLISGRTGLIFLMAFVMLLSIRYKQIWLLFGFIVTATIVILFSVSLSNYEVITKVIDFAFEFALNFLDGKLQTNSTNDLIENHLFIPPINNYILGDNIFIGDGDEVLSKIGRSSDSAFIINYTAYGIIGFIMTTLMVIINSKIIIQYFRFSGRKNILYYVTCLICFFLVLGLYVKILVYISSTLLKAMVFVTIILKHIDNTETKYS